MFPGMGDDLLVRFIAHLRGEELFPAPGLALLAVSGGPDSVALLELMRLAREDLGFSLAVGHVDHGIAPESADVAEQVLGLASRAKVPGHLVALNLGPDASETRARRERYRGLRALQRKTGARYLVTAHHADDQIETVLYRVLKGSAPAGLAGIPARGPNGLVRPLLPFRRAELREWLETRRTTYDARLTPYQDPANSDVRHDRSWLRVRILPLLRERYERDLDARLLRLQAHAEDEKTAWSHVLRALPELEFRSEGGVFSVACAPLQTYDKTLSVALLRALAREAGAKLGPDRAARLTRFLASGTSGHGVELGQGWVAELAFGRLRLVKPVAGVPSVASWGSSDAGRAEWGGWEIEWHRDVAGESTRRGLTTWVPVSSGEVRAPQRGDRILPLGGVGHRPVRRLLMEARVPRVERARYPVLVRSGKVVWLPGVCRASLDVPLPGAAALRIDVRAR